MLHINARSLVNKFDEINTFLSATNKKWNFIFVSETWFTEGVEKSFLLDDYNLFCASRHNKLGGGSAIYALNSMHTKQAFLYNFTTAEAVFLQINLNRHTNCLIIQIYRAPRNNIEFLSELEQCLEIISKLNVLTYIVGDFNVDLFSIHNNNFSESFFNLMCSYGFLPTISKATRVSTESSTLIDNIFCNDISLVQQSCVIKTYFSDHFSVFSSLDITPEKKTSSNKVNKCFDYRYINNLNEFLVTELEDFQSEMNPEIACNKIIDAYNKGIAKFSKNRKCTRKNNAIQPWITPGLLNSIYRKGVLFNIKLRNPNAENISKYNTYRNCLTIALRNAKKHYFKQQFTKYHNNPKQTWETLNKLLRQKSSNKELPNKLINDKGKEIDNDISISKEFNKFFTEIGQKLKSKITSTTQDPLQNVGDFLDENMSLSTTNANEVK